MFGLTTAKITRLIYFKTVFLTGAAVLIFEVAAVRMLAPYFGSSLYVLSSVLTTILAALSMGYYIGGRVADRAPHYLALYIIIGSAGIVMLLLQILSQSILPFANEIFSLTSGPLILSLLLFFVPAFLLGIDSPFVIKLLTRESTLEHAGAVVGSTFFFSTVGSIVGSITAGFVFIPYLGLTLTITAISLGLIVWAITAATLLGKIQPETDTLKLPLPPVVLATVALILGIVLAQMTLRPTLDTITGTTLYQADGFYSHLHIFDRTFAGVTYRFLKNDSNNSSAIIPGSNEIVFPYAQFSDIFSANIPNAKNYLVLGGGSYTIPRHMHILHPNLPIDVVEIESSLYPLAQKYFELPTTPLITNHELDARVFLQSTSTKYDVLFSDVMNSGFVIPSHLVTVEFFTDLRSHLTDEGIGVINFVGSLDTDNSANLTGSMIKTIASVFPNYKIIALQGTNYKKIQNLLFIVRAPGKTITIPDLTIKNPFDGATSSAHTLIVDNSKINLDNQVIFTDDKSLLEPLVFKQFSQNKI